MAIRNSLKLLLLTSLLALILAACGSSNDSSLPQTSGANDTGTLNFQFTLLRTEVDASVDRFNFRTFGSQGEELFNQTLPKRTDVSLQVPLQSRTCEVNYLQSDGTIHSTSFVSVSFGVSRTQNVSNPFANRTHTATQFSEISITRASDVTSPPLVGQEIQFRAEGRNAAGLVNIGALGLFTSSDPAVVSFDDPTRPGVARVNSVGQATIGFELARPSVDLAVVAATGEPRVFLFNQASLAQGYVFGFLAFDGFTGNVRVGMGDFNADGFTDVVIGAGSEDGGRRLKVYDGPNFVEQSSREYELEPTMVSEPTNNNNNNSNSNDNSFELGVLDADDDDEDDLVFWSRLFTLNQGSDNSDTVIADISGEQILTVARFNALGGNGSRPFYAGGRFVQNASNPGEDLAVTSENGGEARIFDNFVSTGFNQIGLSNGGVSGLARVTFNGTDFVAVGTGSQAAVRSAQGQPVSTVELPQGSQNATVAGGQNGDLIVGALSGPPRFGVYSPLDAPTLTTEVTFAGAGSNGCVLATDNTPRQPVVQRVQLTLETVAQAVTSGGTATGGAATSTTTTGTGTGGSGTTTGSTTLVINPTTTGGSGTMGGTGTTGGAGGTTGGSGGSGSSGGSGGTPPPPPPVIIGLPTAVFTNPVTSNIEPDVAIDENFFAVAARQTAGNGTILMQQQGATFNTAPVAQPFMSGAAVTVAAGSAGNSVSLPKMGMDQQAQHTVVWLSDQGASTDMVGRSFTPGATPLATASAIVSVGSAQAGDVFSSPAIDSPAAAANPVSIGGLKTNAGGPDVVTLLANHFGLSPVLAELAPTEQISAANRNCDVAVNADNTLTVNVWSQEGGSVRGRLISNTAPASLDGAEFTVHLFVTGVARGVSVDWLSNDQFVVVNDAGVAGSRSLIATVFRVQTGPPRVQPVTVFLVAAGQDDFDPDVACDTSDSSFWVSWTRLQGASSNVFMQRFAADGTALTPGPIQMSGLLDIAGTASNSAVAVNAMGDGVVVWEADFSAATPGVKNVFQRLFNKN